MSKWKVKLMDQLMTLEKRYPDRRTMEAAGEFLNIHLRIARSTKNASPSNAIEQYKLAEEYQGCICSFATGAGEGLASKLALYEIMSERADLEEQLAHASKQLPKKLRHLQEVVNIWRHIHRDPNIGDLLPKRDIHHLEEQLRSWQT